MAGTPLTFYLKKGTIYVEYRASDGRLQMSTRLKVDPEKYRKGKAPADVKAVLRRIESAIDIHEAQSRIAGATVTKETIEYLLQTELGIKPKQRRATGMSFYQYYSEYLDDVEAGRVLNKGKKYSTSFIKIAKVVGRMLPDYSIAQEPVDGITEKELRKFAAELTGKGYAKNTVATYMDRLESFLTGGRRAGRHKGVQMDSGSFRVSREDIDHAVYLNQQELDRIAALDLEGDAARLRDAFIFGCQVGMRHSDLSRLADEHRKGDVVNINTTKTGVKVWVPLNETARTLWERHGGIFSIPQATEFLFFIKELGKAAGIDEEVLFSRTEAGVKVERWVKKYDMLGTHTMRRSFATNAFRAGVPETSIMKITGHKTYSSFRKYIRLSDEEHAELVSAHPHFK